MGGAQSSSGSHGSIAPRTAVSLPPGASAARVNAIAAVITKTSNSDDAFLALRDTTDAGPARPVQMVCDGTACDYEALCDKPPLTCDLIGPRLEALGLQHGPPDQALYETSRAGNATDFARLTETIYLTVFGASPNYRVSWRTNRQTTELPVQS